MKFWMPTTPYTQKIDYGQRVLINDVGREIPLAWSVSKIDDTNPVGLVKLTFKQEVANLEVDCSKYGLAGWCKRHDPTNLKTKQCEACPVGRPSFVDAGLESMKQIIECGRIEFNGVNAQLRVNGVGKTFTPIFWDRKQQKYVDAKPYWSIKYCDTNGIICEISLDFDAQSKTWHIVSESNNAVVRIVDGAESSCNCFVNIDSKDVLALNFKISGRELSIKCLQLYDMAGKKITLSASDRDGKYHESLDLEVVS